MENGWENRKIYSPESSDGKFDWPSKLGMGTVATIFFLMLFLWVSGCTLINCDFDCQGGGFTCCGPYWGE